MTGRRSPVCGVFVASAALVLTLTGATTTSAGEDTQAVAGRPDERTVYGRNVPSDIKEIADPEADSRRAAKMEALSRELAELGERHGPDVVALQIRLLIGSTGAGALEPTEVRVVGASEQDGVSYLRVEADTGIIVATARGVSARAELWTKLLKPALAGMRSFRMEPENLEVILGYRTDSTASTDSAVPAVASPLEVWRFDAATLGSFLIEPGPPDEWP